LVVQAITVQVGAEKDAGDFFEAGIVGQLIVGTLVAVPAVAARVYWAVQQSF